MKISIEAAEYQNFLRDFYAGEKYKGLRLGQAMHQAFSLHKSTQMKVEFDKLYELDGDEAKNYIRNLFDAVS